MKKLLNDVTRCHDSTCPFRLECARYLQRNMTSGGGPAVSVYSLWVMGASECGSFARQESDKKTDA